MTVERIYTPRPKTTIRGEFSVTPQVKDIVNRLQRTPSELHFYTTAQQTLYADEYHGTLVEAHRFIANRHIKELGKRSLTLMRICDIRDDRRVVLQVTRGEDQSILDAISAYVVGDHPRPDFPHHLIYTDLQPQSLIQDEVELELIKAEFASRARHPSRAMRTIGAQIVTQDFPRYFRRSPMLLADDE